MLGVGVFYGYLVHSLQILHVFFDAANGSWWEGRSRLFLMTLLSLSWVVRDEIFGCRLLHIALLEVLDEFELRLRRHRSTFFCIIMADSSFHIELSLALTSVLAILVILWWCSMIL